MKLAAAHRTRFFMAGVLALTSTSAIAALGGISQPSPSTNQSDAEEALLDKYRPCRQEIKAGRAVFLQPLHYMYPPGFGDQVEKARTLHEEGDLARALTVYRRLDMEQFHEAHNYELIPRIAYLYLRQGSIANARQTYQEARLVWALETGTAKCPRVETFHMGPFQKLNTDYSAVVLESVKTRMCDAFMYGPVSSQHPGLRQYKAELDALGELFEQLDSCRKPPPPL